MDRTEATVRLVDGIFGMFGMYSCRALHNRLLGQKIIGWGDGVFSAVTQFGIRFGVG